MQAFAEDQAADLVIDLGERDPADAKRDALVVEAVLVHEVQARTRAVGGRRRGTVLDGRDPERLVLQQAPEEGVDRRLAHEGLPGLALGQRVHPEREALEARAVVARLGVRRVGHAVLAEQLHEDGAQARDRAAVEHVAEEPVAVALPGGIECGAVAEQVVRGLQFAQPGARWRAVSQERPWLAYNGTMFVK